MENNPHIKSDFVRFTSILKSVSFVSRTAFVREFFQGKTLKTLDVGNLGDGPINVNVRSIVLENGGEYFGLDVNKNLANALDNKNQLVGDLHDLTDVVDSDAFGCVYMGQVIEHTWSPGAVIQECNRILKQDGFLVLDTPNVYDGINMVRFFFKKKDTIGAGTELTFNEAKDNFQTLRTGKQKLLTQPQHKIFYSPAMLEQLLNMHGFTVEHLAFIGKPRNLLHRVFLFFFKQGSQTIGIVARKASLDSIFIHNTATRKNKTKR